MSKGKDYIPSPLAEFFGWQGNLVTKVAAGAVGWGIAAGKVTALTDAQTVYVPLYNAAANPATKTKGSVKAQEDGRKVYEKLIRGFVKENLINNSAVTAQDKIDMGLNPGGTRSPRPAITTAPAVALKAKGGLMVQLEFRVESDASRPSIQVDSDGLEIKAMVGLTPPKSFNETGLNTFFSTKARFNHLFEDESLAGQTFFVYARWANTSDNKKSGPWSALAQVVVR